MGNIINKYEVEEGSNFIELEYKDRELHKIYVSNFYKDKHGEIYKIHDTIIINIDGKAYWGLKYCHVKHKYLSFSMPLYEFLDGHFEKL